MTIKNIQNKYNYQTLRNSDDFFVLEVELDPVNNRNHKLFINDCIAKANSLNANNKNVNNITRDLNTLLKDRYLGIASEELFKNLINNYAEKYNLSKTAISEEFIDYDSHVDIIVKDTNTNITKTIEVRSSYPYASLETVIWKHFDIIGPYTTQTKQYESPKDFYARALININKDSFDFNKKHSIYLVGGATKELLFKIGEIKKLTNINNATYITIKPIANGLDIKEFMKEITK